MISRARWGLLAIIFFAVVLSLFVSLRGEKDSLLPSTDISYSRGTNPKTSISKGETIPRTNASLTAKQMYRRALEADDASRQVPTWEEMNRDRPAEF